MLKEYNFTLKFDLRDPQGDPSRYVELLGENGCDDALIGVGKKGYISLNFIREADSALAAISSAIRDVKRAIPFAVLVEASPDFVGITEAAEAMECTRQNLRQMIMRGGKNAPAPVHEGSSAIWHLAEILEWLRDSKDYCVDDALLEIARVNMDLNVYSGLQKTDSSKQEDIRALVTL